MLMTATALGPWMQQALSPFEHARSRPPHRVPGPGPPPPHRVPGPGPPAHACLLPGAPPPMTRGAGSGSFCVTSYPFWSLLFPSPSPLLGGRGSPSTVPSRTSATPSPRTSHPHRPARPLSPPLTVPIAISHLFPVLHFAETFQSLPVPPGQHQLHPRTTAWFSPHAV